MRSLNSIQAIRSLERLIDAHWALIINTTRTVDAQLRDKMVEVRALLAEYTKQSAGAPVHVVQEHFESVAKASNTEEHYYKLAMYYDDEKEPSDVTEVSRCIVSTASMMLTAARELLWTYYQRLSDIIDNRQPLLHAQPAACAYYSWQHYTSREWPG